MERRILVLEPGGMRVAGTAGFFEGADIQPEDFDVVYANSAAALFAAFWKARKGTYRLWTDTLTRWEVFSWLWNPLMRRRWPADVGFVREILAGEFSRMDLRRLDDPIPEIRVGYLRLEDGKTIYETLTSANAAELLTATCALPVVAPPVPYGEQLVVDGGTVRPIPMIEAWEENAWREGRKWFMFVGNRPAGWQHPPVSRALAWWTFPTSGPCRTQVLRRPKFHARTMILMDRLKEGRSDVTMRTFHPPEAYGIELFERDPNQVERVFATGHDWGRKAFRLGEVTLNT